MQARNISRELLIELLQNNTMAKTASILDCPHYIVKRLAKEYGLTAYVVAHGNKPDFNDFQREVFTGTMLGDACIHPKGYYRFKQKNIDYANYVQQILQPWSSNAYDTLGLRAFYSYVNPFFKAERKRWYPAGKKVVPSDLLLSARIIAFWYMDDGTNIQSNKQASLYTNGFTFDECYFLAEQLFNMGFRCAVNSMLSKSSGIRQPIIRISRRSYFDFIDCVKPHICDSMAYKVDVSSVKPMKAGYGSYKLNQKMASEIRNLYQTGKFTKQELAEKYGVKKLAIWCILSGRTYKEEDGRRAT